jgi:hypothetical protein
MATMAADDWAHLWGAPHCNKMAVLTMRSAAAEGWGSDGEEQTKQRVMMQFVVFLSLEILCILLDIQWQQWWWTTGHIDGVPLIAMRQRC